MNKILRNLDKEEDIFIGLDIQKKGSILLFGPLMLSYSAEVFLENEML